MSRLVTVWCVLILSWVHLCQQRHAMSSVPNSGPSETTPLLSHLENTSSMDSPGAWPDLEAHTSPVHPHQQPPNTALPVLSSDITQEPEALASSPSSPLPTDATVVDMPTNETAVDDTIASSDLPQTIASTDHVDPTDNHPSTPTSSSGPDTAVKPAKSKSGKRGSKTKSKKKPKRKSTSFM
ncbi:hypothetical protein DM01DRAFT_1080757 [Hesseltinella vesiculosa]|uniref:Uncharacterized protein n=1 Tax=Hesseltinella vesiculosa TaxID=101127 RepID=A0A1X2GDY1_9FUNG|nr:hypothetical protein DM01DRAFT_1080757 [Hesseltinella vesiculosa]